MLSTLSHKTKPNVLSAGIISPNKELREDVAHLLLRHPALALTVSGDALVDVAMIGQKNPVDLLFLDLDWPNGDAFEILAASGGIPKVVLIATDDRQARRAFDVRAFDFLVQPIDPERFSQMVRVLLGLDWRKPTEAVSAPAAEAFFVPFERGRRVVQATELVAILAYGNYTQVCLREQKEELVLRSLSSWMQQLPESQFLRVHRNAAINIKHLRMLTKPEGGDTYHALLEGRSEPVPVSRRSVAGLKARMAGR